MRQRNDHESDIEDEEETPFLVATTRAIKSDNKSLNNSSSTYIKPTLWTKQSHAIPIFYFLLGFLQSYPRVALREFMMQTLHASPALQQIMTGVIMLLPWQFKVLYGFLSDAFPINGQHRKPYMLFGLCLYSICWIGLGLSSATSPTIGGSCFFLFMGTFGLIFTDVMADTLVVERMKAERDQDIGNMQTLCWCMRFAGNLCGLGAGGLSMSVFALAPHVLFLINGILPLLALPSLLLLKDAPRNHEPDQNSTNRETNNTTIEEGMHENKSNLIRNNAWAKLWAVWDVMAEPWLWRPMLFVFLNAAMPSSSDAFVNFMLLPIDKDGLGISMGEYSILLAIGSLASMGGALLYQNVFSDVPWRKFFYIVSFLGLPISLTSFIVIFRWNEQWGVSSFAFLFGSEVVSDVVGFLLQMPILIMSAKLSPKHIEGTVYALQVSTNNIGGSVSGQLGALLTEYYGVTEEHMGNLWKLTLVCIALGMLPIAFIPCLPEHAEHKVTGERSNSARWLLLTVLVGSLFVNTISSVVEVVAWGSGSNSTVMVGGEEGNATVMVATLVNVSGLF